MNRSPDDLKATPEFKAFFDALDRDSYLYKILKDGIDALRENMLVGEKVEKKKWPREYVSNYGITNLFRFDLDRRNRLTYTIIAEDAKKIVCVLECMDHETYNRRFGYR